MHRMDPPEDPDAEPMPEGGIVPMLAKAGEIPRDESAYALRGQVGRHPRARYSEPGRLRLETRNLRDVTAAVSGAAPAQPRAELAPRDPRRRDRRLRRGTAARASARLQQRMHLTSRVGDQAADEGHAGRLRDLRRARGSTGTRWSGCRCASGAQRLEALELVGPSWQTPAQLEGTGAELLEATAKSGLEGLLAKRLDAPVRAGPALGRVDQAQEPPPRRVRHRRLGAGRGPARRAHRRAAGRAPRRRRASSSTAARSAPGFSDRTLEDLAARLAPLRVERSPLATQAGPRGAQWVEPLLVCEVEYTDFTPDGMLRHPSFKGLREDKSAPVDVVAELPKDGREVEVDGRRIKVSNWSKVLWPKTGFTKGDLVAYYARVAPVLLPHLRERPLTLKRYPNGVDAQHFYEKQCPKHAPGVGRARPRCAGRSRSRSAWPTTRRRSCGWPTSPTSSCTRRCAQGRGHPAAGDDGLRPRPGPARRHRPVLRGGAGAARAVRGRGAEVASRRRRAPRACRSTCR